MNISNDSVVFKNINNTTQKRIHWIDIYKGILMICVLVGHVWSGKITTFMYVFHMSAFFFISGYTEKLESKSLFELIQVKFKSLIIPYIGVNILYSIVRLFLWGVGLNSKLFVNSYHFNNIAEFIKSVLRYPNTNDIFVGSWFLLVLFFVSIFAKILFIVNGNKINLVLVIVAFALGGVSYWLIYNNIKFIIPIDLALIGMVYYIIGTYISRQKFLDKIEVKNILVVVLITCIYFYLFIINIFKNVDYVSRTFNGYFNDIISAMIGIIIIYIISRFIEQLSVFKICEYIGKNSLALMLLQFAIFRFITMCEVILGIKGEQYLRNNSIATQSCYDVFFYVVLTIIIFYILNKNMSNNKVYSGLFLGKFNMKLINKRYVKVLIYIILLITLVIGIPYKSIYNIKNYGKSIEYCLDLKGRYEDSWVGEELDGTFKSGNKGTIDIKLFSMPENSGNSVKAYDGNDFIGEFTISDGESDIVLEVPKNKKISLKLEFKKYIIPAELNNKNADLRKLSVIINSIKAE